MLKRPFLQTALMSLLGLSLISCGGDSATDRISNNQPPRDLTEADIPNGQLGIKLPFYTENVDFEIYEHSSNTLIKTIDNFSGADIVTTIPAEYSRQLLRIVMTPRDNARVYDVLQNKLVTFNTPIHSISNIGLVVMGPMQEFIYQRALMLTGQFLLETADPSLIQNKHLSLAQSDVNRSLGNIFTTNFPSIWHETSLSGLGYIQDNAKKVTYQMTYHSLGHLKRWSIAHPSNPYYSDFIQNIAVDLRDGYLDGKSINGNQTPFIATLQTTRNIDPAKNNSIDYAALQKSARENYGNEVKAGAIEVALSFSESQLNPTAFKELTNSSVITQPSPINSTTQLRTNGAGDYTRAFGFTHSAYCSNSNYPCLQGMNADTTSSTYSDIEALVGYYQTPTCTLNVAPLGQITLSVGDRIYFSQVNNDTTDHALRISSNNHRYIWNIGSGESYSPFYIQIHVTNGKIQQVFAGHSTQPYPTQLEEELAYCQFT